MSILYLTGGKQLRDKARPEWFRYEKGVILKLDMETFKTEVVAEYTEEDRVGQGAIIYKSSFINGNELYCCTQTEVIVYSLPTFTIKRKYSHFCFNDVHHCIPSGNGNNILVVSTGLDAVFEINTKNEIVAEWSAYEKDIWERFDRNIDYREVVSTKPHAVHPNHVSIYNDQIWVTRLVLNDAVCLNKPNLKIDIEAGKPHDGVLVNGKFYYTTVNGFIVVADPSTNQVLKKVDLNKINKQDKALGWCRGVKVLDNDVVIVGFSRIRSTKFEANLDWLKLLYYNTLKNLPTRIAAYNINENKLLWEVNLEKQGMDAVFSILKN